MGCCRKPVVAAAAEVPAPCNPFRGIICLIVVLIVMEFLCCLLNGGFCCGEAEV